MYCSGHSETWGEKLGSYLFLGSDTSQVNEDVVEEYYWGWMVERKK